MNTVRVRKIEIGSGKPKICVPIVGKTREEILNCASRISSCATDIVEWRADWYDAVFDEKAAVETLRLLRGILGEIPLLFTFRTAKEGGEKEISPEQYTGLNCRAIASGAIDLIDAELFSGQAILRRIIAFAHENGVKVIVSNHDFKKTPPQEELVARLCKMQELGADLPKLAVMPQTKKDVLVLLAATEEMTRMYADRPIITMSMSGTGLISRLCGELFGSSITFGAVGKNSAPGQMQASDLGTILELFHQNIN